VIGSGISGLATSWLLSREHEVTLYEASDYLGGHTHTHDIELGGRNLAIDTGNAEGWAATFTPDGVFNNTNKGHDALVQFIKDWREKRDGANRRHLNSNMVLTPTADGANASIYLLLLNVGVRPATIATTGIYEDVLVRTPQGWRFKSRIVHADPGPRTELK